MPTRRDAVQVEMPSMCHIDNDTCILTSSGTKDHDLERHGEDRDEDEELDNGSVETNYHHEGEYE